MKKNIILISSFILVVLVSACGVSDDPSKANIKIVEQYQQALKNHDVEGVQAVLAENYVGYGPSIGDSMKRDDAILNWDYNMQNLYEEIEFKRAKIIALSNYQGNAQGDWVSSWGKLYIKFKEHGNEATIWSNTIYLIDDGKIKKSIMFFNEADALRQAGYNYTYTDPNK